VDEVRATELFARYSKTWRAVFTHLGGWTPLAIADWEERFLSVDGCRVFLGHKSPTYEIAVQLVPATLRSRLSGLPLVRLRSAIVEAVEVCGDIRIDFPAEDVSYDWSAAKLRLERVFAAHEKST
jgi:hypothetical protein